MTDIKKNRISALDGLRGYAVLAVFLYHTLDVPKSGHLGVDIFFVLSGFLISSHLYQQLSTCGTIDLSGFYLKRCARLLPAFFVACVLFEAIAYCFPSSASLESPLKLLSLLFVSNFLSASGQEQVGLMNHLWTLSVEWQFYLLWPAVLFGLHKLRLRGRGIGWILLITFILAVGLKAHGNQFAHFDGLLVGSLLPLLTSQKVVKRAFNNRICNAALLSASISALILLILFPVPQFTMFNEVATSIATVALIFCTTFKQSGISRLVLANRLAQYFGRISYGLYLYHFPIAALLYVNSFPRAKIALVACVVAIPLADVSWRCLEQPVIRRFGNRKSQRAAAAFGRTWKAP
ncbi:acyltransferase family protein [Chitinasiproducens palmae]|uniref:Peptidoglycan/LPS O-acetylase OafA/YrhL, contains acyltransferase and SGNH-hydrolase domains n=1 Tax=Chitinasiproducens palmae TaxID=1770053 RepID=A0A1H2PS41_9BURK|nr:acyltransferase [Chitinasiproducens palmae]SDV49771.1 Peptidoglycan/LPS O-acetylase OafA/YrhL, contains acyltransferase and SGNH-hydrolase domains [Chitinasiproducens palmae]